jgi:hypothetical protein
VDSFFSDIELAYQTHIEAAGKEYHFLILLAFLVSWGFIRTSAHMIHAQVSWWPGNVQTKGGTHIHHLVWGILLVLSMGYLGLSFDLAAPWIELVAIGFGIGMGLTLDEFALWLNLKDVYWSQQGRRSIDAVIVATTVTGMVLVGFTAWVDVATEVEDAVFALVGAFGMITIGAVVVNLAKEKFGMAIVGLFIPPVGVVGALRLGRPGSLWARLYRESKRGRARARFGEQAPPSPAQPAPSQSAAGSG